jgi:hypothetical protein
MTFREQLAEQRWDDHRYYHHSLVNQSLHLVSALSFILAYALVLSRPAIAVLIGWLFAMPSRQIGHFFFEPRGYDHVNHATHEYKEQVKVGYNLRRKVALLSIWAAAPVLLLVSPTLFGMFPAPAGWPDIADHVALMWLMIGAGAIVFRVVQLSLIRDLQTGLVWATKILSDPFHDVLLYHKAPLQLLRGERLDTAATDQPA